MIFDGITSKIFNAAVKKIQGNIDNIQTTSRATLSTAGWYRVAELSSNRWWFSLFEIGIYKDNTNSAASSSKIRFTATGGDSGLRRFETISSATNPIDGHNISRIRITTDNAKCYIEVYYAVSKQNMVGFVLNNAYSPLVGQGWILYKTPTLTSETVDGVTVTTTYDIPANASPVTNLDLDLRTLPQSLKSGTDLNTCTETGVYAVNGLATNYVNTPNAEAHNGFLWVTYNAEALVIYQRYYSVNQALGYERKKQGGTWSTWNGIATTADLANYLPLSGGYITGAEFGIGSANSENGYTFGLRNSKRYILEQVLPNGQFRIRSGSNDILTSNVDGTNTFNGTATGNLPLTNDTTPTVTTRNNSAVKFNCTGGAYAWLSLLISGESVGDFGFTKDGKPLVFADGAARGIIHEGNSQKVVVSATPLTAEGSIRVW